MLADRLSQEAQSCFAIPLRSQQEIDRIPGLVDGPIPPSIGRDVAATKAFFRKAIKAQGSPPRTITLDGCAASHRAVREMQVDGQLPADTKLAHQNI
jgi:hypothetical protein